jgi:hypothetical protein
MVKIFVKDDKLYLEKAGKEIQVASSTIYHHKNIGVYKIESFISTNRGNKILKHTQKTYPLVDIKLEDTRREDITGRYKSYYYTKGKNYYINYYVYD